MRPIVVAITSALLFVSFSAQAVQVRPLYSEYSPATTKGTLHVANSSSSEKTYQVVVERWSVQGGEKVRTQSSDLRFAPSIFTMAPGKTQTLRWALTAARPGEQAFRIRLEEVPDPSLLQQPGLSTTLNLDFPWFWRARDLSPNLSIVWDGPTLVVSNEGHATAQLVDLVTGSVSKPGLVGYVLPGETARFDLGGQGTGSVSLKVNGKDTTLAID